MQAGPSSDRRRVLVFCAGAVLTDILCIAVVDRPFAEWAHGLHRPSWCVALTWIADAPVPLAVLGLAAFGIAWLAGWQAGPASRLVLAICIATLAADAAKDSLKFAFGRPWPETWVDHNPSWIGTHVYGFFPFHGGRGFASFPSGHTTVIAAPCAAAWQAWPRWRPLWAALPALVVVGLLGSDFHFVSDCVAGAALGIAMAAAARI